MARAKKKIAVKGASTVEAMQPLEQDKERDAISIEATEEIIELVKELHRLEELKKRLLELEDDHRHKIMDFMGTHQSLKTDCFTLASWKSQTRKSFDSSSFKIEFTDLYNLYLKETSFRVFRLC